MIRNIDLAFIKIHILYHADKGEVFGVGLMDELKNHGYKVGPGLLYPTLAKMEKAGFLICEKRIVRHKQRKYYQATPRGRSLLAQMKNKIIELYNEVIEK